MTSSMEPRAMMEAAVQAAARLLGVKQVALWLHDDSVDVLRLGARVPTTDGPAEVALAVDDNLAGSVLRSGRPYVTSSLAQHPLWKPALGHSGPEESGMFVPFFYHERPLGLLVAVGTHGRTFSDEDVEAVEALVPQVAMAIKNAQLYQETWRQARQLATILVVNKRLALGPELEEILSVITEEAARLLGVEAAGLRLREGDELVRAASFGPAKAIMVRERLRIGESLSGRVAKEDRPIRSSLAADSRTDQLGPPSSRSHGLHAWLGVPMRGRKQVVGVLFVADGSEKLFDHGDIQMLEAFADQAAIAIENARAFRQEQERRKQLEAVREVTAELTHELDLTALLKLITRRASELVDAESGVVHLWEESAQVLVPRAWHGFDDWIGLVRLGLGQGAPGAAAEKRQAMILNDYPAWQGATPLVLERTSISASLSEPILYQDRLIGVITVNHETAGRRFRDQDQKLLSIFADQAAIAIQNARLHEATNQRAHQLAVLNDLTGRLTTVLDLKELARQILVAAQTLIPGAVGRFWERVADDDSLHLVASVGLRNPETEGILHFRAGEGLMGITAATRQPICSKNVANDERFLNREWAAREQVLSCVFVPLIYDERLYGILSILTRYEHEFTDEEIGLLRSFADQAAIAIENARLYRELAERENRLRDLVGRLLLAQEEERRRVAYDVHDGLAQVAAAAQQHLEAFSSRYRPRGDRARQELDVSRELARRTVGEARRVIAGLRPTVLDDFGLATALRKEVEALQAEGWQIRYREELGGERLPPTIETALFRVAQEALENVRKHAQTTRALLALRRIGQTVRLEVRDWGCGFRQAAVLASSGPSERVGLPGMQERIAWLGGRCTVRSRPGAGTRILVEVPLAKPREAPVAVDS
jgi:GAF domain-containing protein